MMPSLIFLLQLLKLIPAVWQLDYQVVAAPGSDVTLDCMFPHSETDNPLNLVLVWQRGTNEVVHNYYQARDMLNEQSTAYKGRTQLYPDQLAVGNASLRLMGVQASDHGEYTCSVANEQGKFQTQVVLLVAAPYEVPQLAFQTTCDSIILTFRSAMGFPQPDVLWISDTLNNITDQSNTTMVLTNGSHYEILSRMRLKPSHLMTVTFEQRLELLNQSFSHRIMLHPIPECCGKPALPKNRLFFLSPLIVVALLVIITAIIIYAKLHPPLGPRSPASPPDEMPETEEEERM
ncbi:hypothetical protein GJAV_G00004690 [Gymnothorax javanicus]|nr:hypothetical protein GJAV_G00004690 [Gymnothorax javanicus]